MFIVPLEKSFDWRRPPVVTLLLVVVNCLVLFIGQAGDDEALTDAIELYAGSSLPEIELPLYLQELEARHDYEQAGRVRDAIEDPADMQSLALALLDMEGDTAFMRNLRGGALVAETQAPLDEWREARAAFEDRLDDSVSYSLGFIPSKHELLTLLTHMFLHGGVAHLLGNMLFLFLVGYTVELAIGSLAYLGCYLLAGLGAVLLFWLFDPGSGLPLVGASGAIAGLMGMYAVLFGARRIRFFYCVVVYFDYVKAPAIIMFPLWVANEIVQHYLNEGSNVAYTAHLGGLLAGAALALAVKRLTDEVDEDYLGESERAEDRTRRLEKAAQLLGKLEVGDAKTVLRSLRRDYPDDRQILLQLYRAEKLSPLSAEYHTTARQLLDMLRNDAHASDQLHEVFIDYLTATRGKIRLQPALLANLATRFAKTGHLITAQRIASCATARRPRGWRTRCSPWRSAGSGRTSRKSTGSASRPCTATSRAARRPAERSAPDGETGRSGSLQRVDAGAGESPRILRTSSR